MPGAAKAWVAAVVVACGEPSPKSQSWATAALQLLAVAVAVNASASPALPAPGPVASQLTTHCTRLPTVISPELTHA